MTDHRGPLPESELYARHCVRDVVEVIAQLPDRAATRADLILDRRGVAILVLWTMLRWERNFLVAGMEEAGIDLDSLAREIDALLRSDAPQRADGEPGNGRQMRRLRDGVRDLLDRAQSEAGELGHSFLGTEHLWLAILRDVDGALATTLADHGLSHDRVQGLVQELLGQAVLDWTGRPLEVEPPFGARWDTPATGVPRRFSLAMAFVITTMYAVLFAFMQVLGARNTIFVMVTVMVTGVGFAQMFVFGGKYPRAASLWAGGVLFPISMLVLLVLNLSDATARPNPDAGLWIASLVFSIPLGVFFGYLAGGLCAGVFFVVNALDRRIHGSAGEADAEDEIGPIIEAEAIGGETPHPSTLDRPSS